MDILKWIIPYLCAFSSMSQELLPDENLWTKLIKKGFWLYFFAFLVAPAGYLARIVISNSVSVAEVGVLYSVLGLISLLSIYNDLGLTESLQYFIPRYWVKKQYNYIKTSIYLSLLVQISTGIVLALILWIATPRLATHYFHSPEAVNILKYFCFYFLGINLFQVLQSIFYSFQNTFAYQFVDFVRMGSILVFTVLFRLGNKASIQRYSLSWILGLGIGILVAGAIFLKKYRKSVFQGQLVREKPMIKEYLHYAFWVFLGLNVGQLFGQIIQQLIIVLLWPEPAGYYSNFLSLFGITNIVVGPIIGFIFPVVSELISKKDDQKIYSLFSFFYSYFLVAVIIFAVFLSALWPEIALVVFNKSFVFSGELLQIGAIFSIFSILVGFNFSVLAGMGKIKERVKLLGIASLILTTLSIGGILRIQLYGAIFAMGISYILLFILSFNILYQKITFKINRKIILKNLIFTGLLGIGIWYLKSDFFVFEDAQRYQNFGKIIIFWLSYLLILIGINRKEILLIKKELKKIKTLTKKS